MSDGASYSSDYDGTNVDAAVFSKADLTLNGEGVLNINGNYKCAAVSKDDLIICGLTLNAKSVGSAIEGKDCVKIKDAAITVNSGADAIKSTNSEDADRGFVYIESGTCTLTAAKDGIQAESAVKLSGGEITITSGGGAPEKVSSGDGDMRRFESSTQTDDESTKGIKAEKLIIIENGTVNANSADDTVHSNGEVEINGGTVVLCGSSGMAETFSESSSQASLMYTLENAAKAGSSVALSNSDGKVIASFVPSKQYTNVVISSPELKKGSSYTLSVGGTVSECDKNGYTNSGKVSGAESTNSVEISSVSTIYGTAGNKGGMKGGPQGQQGGGFGKGNSAGNPPSGGPGNSNSDGTDRKAPPELSGNTKTAQS